jgi:hypothetical protein
VTLIRVMLQVADIITKRRFSGRSHPALQSPADRGLLVGREIDARFFAQLIEERAELAVLILFGNDEHPGQQVMEQGTDCLRIGDDIDRGGGQ